ASVVDLDGGREVALRGHLAGQETNFLRFSHDGRLVATTSDDGTVRVFDAATGRPAWRAPAMIGDPPVLLTHRGWEPMREGATLPDGLKSALEGVRYATGSGALACAI